LIKWVNGIIESIMKQVFIYPGIWSDKAMPWPEVIGLFLFIAGFIIGLGAVTVIDLQGVM
jgi:hypothetical protein